MVRVGLVHGNTVRRAILAVLLGVLYASVSIAQSADSGIDAASEAAAKLEEEALELTRDERRRLGTGSVARDRLGGSIGVVSVIYFTDYDSKR